MELDFDYVAARNAGYSDEDILRGLQNKGKLTFDLDAALKANHDPSEIIQSVIGKPAAPAAPAEEPSAWRRAGDVGLSLVKGAISVPETAVGLADIVTGGYAGKGAEALGFRPKEAKAFLDEYLSPQQKAANKEVADAEGFWGTAAAAIKNPSTIGLTAVESAPSMLAGGAIGRGVTALAPKVAPWVGGAIGEGVVGAGQAAENTRQNTEDGTLSAAQSLAAVGSGTGTALFGGIGGRMAAKFGVTDIDTVLANGAQKITNKGVLRRIVEGGVSEGVFEEMPQSIQEQMWQNAALGKPLMEGVPEQAAMGALAGGLIGGGSAGLLRGKPDPVTGEPTEEPAAPLLLENRPDPFIVFPDGSVGRQSEVDDFLSRLPESERNGARARMFGYQEQVATTEDITQAKSVDEAIAAARAVVDAPHESVRNEQIDQAWADYKAQISAARVAEFDAAEQSRRDADVPKMAEQQRDQNVEQAEALTSAQGYDSGEPTAMQLAMQHANERRQLLMTPVSQRGTMVAESQPQEAQDGNKDIGVVQSPSAAGAELPMADEGRTDRDVRSGVSNDRGDISPSSIRDDQRLGVASTSGRGTGRAQDAVVNVPSEKLPQAAQQQSAPAEVESNVKRAREILTAAGVGGNDRLAAIKGVRSGETSLDDLLDAHPPKAKDEVRATTENGQPSAVYAPRDQAAPAIESDESRADVAVPPVATKAVSSALSDEHAGESFASPAEANTYIRQNDIAKTHRVDNSGRDKYTIVAKDNSADVARSRERVAQRESALASQLATATENAAKRTAAKSSPVGAISGAKIDKEWTAFADDSGSLNIDRAEMPQVKAEHRGALVNYLNARDIAHESTEVDAGDLKPTQREFSNEKVQKAKDFEGGDRSILISSDNHILDGHHQWLAKLDNGEPVKVIRLDAPIRELLDQVKEFPSSEVADGATETEAPAKSNRALKREEAIASLDGMTPKQLRQVADTDTRIYMQVAVAEKLQAIDDENRQKRSDVAKKYYTKSKQIDPDKDSMAEAIAKIGGINRESAKGRMRLAPEELRVKAGIRPVFVNGGLQMDQMGAALAELGYVMRDENGKHDQSDYEEKLAEVANGADIYTPNGMMVRAESAKDAAMRNAEAMTETEFARIEDYADQFDDEMQRQVDAAFDAEVTNEELSDEQIDAIFGISKESRSASEENEGTGPREGNRGTQAQGSGEEVDEKPLLSKSDKQRGMEANAVIKAITRLRVKWLNFTRVNVVQSVDDLPYEIAQRLDTDDQTEGFYDPKTKSVYLIADNIASPERAVWVASHEVAHGGLRMLRDKTVNEALNIAGANRFIKELAAAIEKDRGDVSGDTSIEEAVAELSAAIETGDFSALEDRYGVKVPASAQNGIRGAVARVYEAVKRFLAAMTGKPVSSVSDADVRALIGEQRAAVEGRESTEREPQGERALASSIPMKDRTIEVDGVRRPITNSKGQIIADTFGKQQAFYKWFGSSAVVDEGGKPLILYHGTQADFTVFESGRKTANTTMLGEIETSRTGVFLTPDKDFATSFSTQDGKQGTPNVMPLYASIQDPFEMRAGIGWNTREAMKNAGIDVYNLPEHPTSNTWKAFDGENGKKLQAFLEDRGHDGVIITEENEDGDSVDVYIAFKPSQIKSATLNDGTFSPENADIRFSRAPSKGTEHVPDWAEGLTVEQKAALRKSGAIYDEKTMRQKIDELRTGALKKLQYGILDQFAPIKDQLGKIPYVMARMAKAADGTLEALMLYGRPHLDADGGMLVDTTKKGFIETMQALNGEHDRFFSWLAGRRAEQLKKEGRENLFTNDDISALSTLNQGKMKDGTSREAAYLKAQKDVAELNKSVLDIAEKSGLIDPESRKVWASDFYVPFYRVMEDGISGPSIKSGLVNKKSIKKLKGGTANLGDLTENMLMNWSTLLTASAKNRAARASLEVAADMGVATEADETSIRQMGKSASTKAVSFMDTGKNRWFVVEDASLLAAISALEFNGYNNDAMKAMQWFKNTLTKLVTMSPFFKVRNLIRDSLSVLAVSDIDRNPLANLKNGYSLLRDDTIRAQLVAGGGMYRFGMTMEGNRAEHIKDLVDAGIADDTILNTHEKMQKFFGKLWRSYEEIGDLSENVNRAALYKTLREKGASHLEASFEARDLMDFGLSGAWAGVRALNQILPFFGARLAGMYKLGRGYNDDPRRMMYVVGSLVLATIALSAAYKDDDDFKKRSDSDRANYWWFKVGGTAYRIPRPFEIGAAATVIDDFSALFYDSENMSADRFASQLAEIVNHQLAMNPIPQVFRPVIDVYANKDAFSGRPIESLAMQRLRPEDRYTSNTSELARLLSKSGVLVDPVSLVAGTGVKQLSPVQIDSLIKGYFAGAGVLAVASADGLLHHTLIDRGAALPISLRTLTGSFAEDLPTNSSRYVDMLYKTAQDVEQTYASYQNALKKGDIEEARKIQQHEGRTLAKYHMIESLKKNESRIGQVIQRTMNDKTLTGEQKEETIKRLKAAQDRIARQLVTND